MYCCFDGFAAVTAVCWFFVGCRCTCWLVDCVVFVACLRVLICGWVVGVGLLGGFGVCLIWFCGGYGYQCLVCLPVGVFGFG